MCVVSAFYKIPSKMPYDWYIPKLINFFSSVKSVPIVFFTTPDVITDIGQHTTTDHVHIVYLPFEELVAFQKYGVKFWERQKSRDPQEYHTKELGAVWYEKKEFVLRAMKLRESDVYIWCDAGCIRDSLSVELSKEFGTRTQYSLNDNRMHIQQVSYQPKEQFYHFSYFFVAGGIIAGNSHAWIEYSELYDSTLIKYDAAEVPAIVDQYIMKSCIDVRPELFVLYDQDSRIINWFKFLEFL